MTDTKAPIQYGDLDRPSWREVLPALLHAIASQAPSTTRADVIKLLERMAASADAWNAHECDK